MLFLSGKPTLEKDIEVDYKKPELSAEALERIGNLKEKSLLIKQLVCPERARYLTQVYREDLSDPMILRRARALEHIFSRMTVWIGDGACCGFKRIVFSMSFFCKRAYNRENCCQKDEKYLSRVCHFEVMNQ